MDRSRMNVFDIIDDIKEKLTDLEYKTLLEAYSNTLNIKTVIYKDDSIYNGEMKNGKKHGFGKHIFPNKYVIEGEFKNDVVIGDVTIIYTDRGYFNGKTNKDGTFTGVYVRNNGDKYYGNIKNNYFNGHVKIETSKSMFEGEMKMGKIIYGKEINICGSSYEGEYNYGIPHGNGKYIWEDGSYFEGKFKKGVIDSGKYVNINGLIDNIKDNYKIKYMGNGVYLIDPYI